MAGAVPVRWRGLQITRYPDLSGRATLKVAAPESPPRPVPIPGAPSAQRAARPGAVRGGGGSGWCRGGCGGW